MSLFRRYDNESFSVPTIFDQDFGHGMRLRDLVQPMFDHFRSGYIRPWRFTAGQLSGTSEIQMDKDNFKVVLDVQQFAPSEITVKTSDDYVTVEGKHEEKKDEHGYISRHFVRRYRVPYGVKIDAVTSTLSSDGVLTISAPRMTALEEGKARIIPITMTEAPSVKNTSEAPGKDKN
ncbi:hypothetical protein J437_LFUL012993 [Ladona fulva]|uniref:SHSP domain-containing protein n=1 Tax=Ladona fulva TaxID=123851 RepID=A0A8K0KE96_LADFU|nr:hypothetical protein J437_LFUL012993 [Ladona fulva]